MGVECGACWGSQSVDGARASYTESGIESNPEESHAAAKFSGLAKEFGLYC